MQETIKWACGLWSLIILGIIGKIINEKKNKDAKEILIVKIGDNKVECISEGKDRYKRTLAECFVNDESLSSYLVRNGYAFAYKKYSKKFIPDENYAKDNKIGMWSMKFQYPWDYRRNN